MTRTLSPNVKYRESVRPSAPLVLREDAAAGFEPISGPGPAPAAMSPLRFFAWFGGTILVFACLTILLTVAVDPYRMYGTAPIAGWTAMKPRVYDRASLATTYQLERIRPNTLLLGNSRVQVGFDPESPRWPSAARPVFNAALPGRDLRTALDMLRDAIAVHPPQTVILGLDILDFLQRPDRMPVPIPPIRPDERRLLVGRDGKPNPARLGQVWRDRLATTLSIDAILDSLYTLFDQNPLTSETMTPLGFDPMNPYRLFAARQGYYELFAQKNAIYSKQYRHHPAPDFAEPMRYAEFRYLRAIIDLSIAHRIDLILFIHPYHADYLDMLHEVGLWPSFENWKRALVKTIERPMPNAEKPIRLFDFSGYSEYATEAVPPPGDRSTAMEWYWEAGHYKPALGNEMLAAMLGADRQFGFLLDSADIEQVLAQIRERRDRYIAHRELDLDRGTALPGQQPGH